MDPKSYLSKINVVCVVDPKKKEREERLQKTANLAYDSISKRFDLVYQNGQSDQPADDDSQDSSQHKKAD